MHYELSNDTGDSRTRSMGKRDQFAPQLLYFANCIREQREPEPDGWEGYADVRIIKAIHRAARTGQRVRLDPIVRTRRPTQKQAIWRPGLDKPEEVNAEGPGR
jgi:hypothetical protein